MKLRVKTFIGVMVVGVFIGLMTVHADPLLKAGDRLVFLGDSITEQRMYTRYVMNYFSLRYPGTDISFRNAGWSGDTAPGGLYRLERDVLSLKPTVVSICFGMNDGGYIAFDQGRYDRYMTGMTGLVAALKKASVKVVLLTPGCIDPDRSGNKVYNATLTRYAQAIKELAAKESQPFFDLNSLMLDVQTRAKAENPQFTMIPDSVHPSAPGQAVMSFALLKALACDVKASGLVLDAPGAAATTDRCKVEGLKVTTDEISFTRTDEALPTFFDPPAVSVYKYLPILEELNQYPFQVKGLKAGNWKLTVDGMEVGTFTAEALSVGVNLAGMPGPWQKLGEKINRISAEQENLYFVRWRNFSLAGVPQEADEEFKALLKKMDSLTTSKERERQNAGKECTWSWSLKYVAPAAG